MKINPEDIAIEFKFRNDDKMPATLTIRVGQFEIRGFRIMRSKFEENTAKFVLYPPAIRGGGGKFLDIVRVSDKEEWKKFETIVLGKFSNAQDDHIFQSFADSKSTL